MLKALLFILFLRLRHNTESFSPQRPLYLNLQPVRWVIDLNNVCKCPVILFLPEGVYMKAEIEIRVGQLHADLVIIAVILLFVKLAEVLAFRGQAACIAYCSIIR